jgi:hypothetical protein
MKKSHLSLTVLLITLQSITSFAQNDLFDFKKVRNQDFKQKTYVVDVNGTILNEGDMQTIIRVDENNNRLYQIRFTSGGRRDSTVCSLSDLRPIFFSTKGEGMNQTIEYTPGKVTAFAEINGKVTSNGTYDVSNNIYDYFMDSYMVSLMPLREGFKGGFNVFSGIAGKLMFFDILTVVKDVIRNAEGKQIPAYLVICDNAGVKLNLWYSIHNNNLIRFVANLPDGRSMIRELITDGKSSVLKEQFEFDVYNRSIEKVNENGKEIIRFNEAAVSGIAWLKDREFSEGTLEFDAKGRDELQRSFIGIAFHGTDNQNYEAVYFRPFNFQATDPVRHIHAVQYTFEPKFNFQTLRDTRKDEFEAPILPSSIKATDWFHAKIEVKNGRVKVFVNNSITPCLDVPTLNTNGQSGKIGFLVGNNSNGDFANLKIYKLK